MQGVGEQEREKLVALRGDKHKRPKLQPVL